MALEPIAVAKACSSAVRHEAQASLHNRLLLLLVLPRSNQLDAAMAWPVHQTLAPIYLLHVVATIVKHDQDAMKNGLIRGNGEAGTRVAIAEETTSLLDDLRHSLWMTGETTHAEMTEEAVMTAVAETEDTGVEDESRNKAAARCRMHQVPSTVVHRHHHRDLLRDLLH